MIGGNSRKLIHATMQWHALNAARTALNKQRLALEKEIWPKIGRSLGAGHPHWRLLNQIKAQIVLLKRKERAALVSLAKVCTVQCSV